MWVCKHFKDLSTDELYRILALRSEVFVVEQQCVYQDIDGLDPQCLHCTYRVEGEIVAYLRLIPPGLVYESPAMGRFVSAPSHRRTGLGRRLLRQAVATLFDTWDAPQLEVSAQVYLQDFYEAEGFEPVGEPYEEDGIPHIHMICRRSALPPAGEPENR